MKKNKTFTTQHFQIQENFLTQFKDEPACLPDKELNKYKTLLLSKLEEARLNYELLESAISRHRKDEAGVCPTFKLSEDAVDILSKEDIEKYAENLKKQIAQFQYALLQIKNKTYGICSLSGKVITGSRLSSFPQTIMSAEVKKEIIRLLNITS